MKNGKDNGLYKSWYKNGQLKEHRKYSNDSIIGTIQKWAETGELEEEIEYSNGRRKKSTQFYKNGQKSVETYYKKWGIKNTTIEYLQLEFDTLANLKKAYNYRLDTIWDNLKYEESIMISKIEIESL